MSHNAYMLLREGPAQKAFCGMSPNLASRGRGGRGDGGGEGAGKRCKPSSHGHLTCNYTQPRKQRVCFFKKARRAGFFYGPIAFFLRIFDEFFSGFRAKFQKIVTCVAFSIKFAKTNQKFAENSEFCENYSLLFKIIHWCP